MIRSETFSAGVEPDLVVGLGQHEHGVGDRLELALPGPVALQDVLERAVQVVEREVVAQRGHHLVGQRAVDPEFGQLAVEEGLLVQGVGHQLRGLDEPGRLVHPDAALGVDHAGPERDRRDVPLAGGPQAQDEPAGPGGQAGLVGVPDHRRVEQGRRFQCVLLGEVGADQQPPTLADRLVGQQVFADLVEPVQEELAGPLVPLAELPHHLFQLALDLPLGEGRDPGDDPLDPALVRHLERPDDDAGVGRLEDDPGALDVHVRTFRPPVRGWPPFLGTTKTTVPGGTPPESFPPGSSRRGRAGRRGSIRRPGSG